MFLVVNFLENKTFRTPFSKSLNPSNPIWDISAKVDLINPKTQQVIISCLTIVGGLTVSLGEAQFKFEDLMSMSQGTQLRVPLHLNL